MQNVFLLETNLKNNFKMIEQLTLVIILSNTLKISWCGLESKRKGVHKCITLRD